MDQKQLREWKRRSDGLYEHVRFLGEGHYGSTRTHTHGVLPVTVTKFVTGVDGQLRPEVSTLGKERR